jgi:hypothetical protein
VEERKKKSENKRRAGDVAQWYIMHDGLIPV